MKYFTALSVLALLFAVNHVEAHRIRIKDKMISNQKDAEDVETAMNALNEDDVAV